MLRDANAARGDNQRRARRDIERPRPVTAGSARVEHLLVLASERHRMRAHAAGEADDLRRALPFHRQGDEKSGDLRIGRATFHDLGHCGSGLLACEVVAPQEFLD